MTITIRRHNDNDSEDTVATTVRRQRTMAGHICNDKDRRRNEKYSVNTVIMAVEKSKNEYTPIVRIVC